MDGTGAILAGKNSSEAADLARANELRERLERLLREAANVEVELSRADGTIKGVPHYSLIEGRAHELGKQLSREVQQRQMNELAASHSPMAKCPAMWHAMSLTLARAGGEVGRWRHPLPRTGR